ncbi:hypothetical protein VTN77DRAFT_8494 [Rasamsonia byssochlamydoides]|uniref:uncharacterized protein n=1 Tax=Rasamsonia byssochlamydoides TaxID=89139 RepID=UPI00374371A2
MSQDTDRLSQASLAPPVEIAIPSTPPRRSILSASPDLRPARDGNAAPSDKNSNFCSPPPASSSEMTPPPSSQVNAPLRRRSRSRSGSHVVVPASPPSESLEKTLRAAYGASENLPSTADIDAANEEQLRAMAKDLLGVAQEARMSALHFKLQNSLLSFASNEAIKRAEVEQQLARREVEILQSSEYRNRHCVSDLRTPQPSPNPQLDASLKRIEELERLNAQLQKRLEDAERFIEEVVEEENGKHESLREENRLLKKRIRENREHFTLMLDQGSLSSSPRTEFQTPQRKSQSRYPDSARCHTNHDAFATLLAADRVLNGESANVSPTSGRARLPRQSHGGGHIRGSHSMSSLPVTPQRSRDVPEIQYSTPGSRSRERISTPEREQPLAERDRHDRDSTISASDAEEAVTDEDVPASQASSLATNMLRRFPGSSQAEASSPARNVGRSSNLLQTKLFGQVKKAGVERPNSISQKRKGVFEEDEAVAKRSKDVGLGINAWNA